MRRGTGEKCRGRHAGWALILLAPMAVGCASSDGIFGSKPAPATPPAPASSSSPSIGDRISGFFTGQPAQTVASAEPDALAPEEVECPQVDIRQGASTLVLSGPDSGSPALSLRYQATFSRTARECAVRGSMLAMKIGVQGRVIVGPAGGPGQVTVPLRYAVVKEGIEPKNIWTKFYQIQVEVPPGQPSVAFSHVENDVTIPRPPGRELDDYIIYVGFDPQAAEQGAKKPPPKPQAKRPR